MLKFDLAKLPTRPTLMPWTGDCYQNHSTGILTEAISAWIESSIKYQLSIKIASTTHIKQLYFNIQLSWINCELKIFWVKNLCWKISEFLSGNSRFFGVSSPGIHDFLIWNMLISYIPFWFKCIIFNKIILFKEKKRRSISWAVKSTCYRL